MVTEERERETERGEECEREDQEQITVTGKNEEKKIIRMRGMVRIKKGGS